MSTTTIINYQLSSIKEKIDTAYFEIKNLFDNDKIAKILSTEEFTKAFTLLSDLQRFTTEYNTLLDSKDGLGTDVTWEDVSSEKSEFNEEIVHANSDEEFCEDIEDLKRQSDYEMETFGKLKDPDVTLPGRLNKDSNKVEINLSNIPEGMKLSDFGFEKIEETPSN